MSKAVLNSILKKFFINYSSDKLDLKLFSGEIHLNNLIMNKAAMDELFDNINQPFIFKFGMVKALTVDVNIIRASLERIIIEDMILVVGPDPTKVDRNFDLSEKQRYSVFYEMLANLRVHEKWKAEAEELHDLINKTKDTKEKAKLEKKYIKKLKSLKMKKCLSVPAGVMSEMLNDQKKLKCAFKGPDALQYKTLDENIKEQVAFWDMIKTNLEAMFRIKNLRLYYEDTEVLKKNNRSNLNMSFCCLFENLFFESTDINPGAEVNNTVDNFIDLKEVEKFKHPKTKYINYSLNSSKISLEVNVMEDEIVPYHFMVKENLSKVDDLGQFVQYFEDFIIKTEKTSYEILSVRGIRINCLTGSHTETIKKKTSCVYDIIAVDIHLGNYAMNLELSNFNYMLETVNRLNDILFLAQTPEFRPFYKPITPQFMTRFRQEYGSKLQDKDEDLLKILKKSIVRDYYRFCIYASLTRKYECLLKIDAKKRIIWSFMKHSLTFQLISGQSPFFLLEQEKELFLSEYSYKRKEEAIKLNNISQYEKKMDVQPGDTSLDIYAKNLVPFKEFAAKFHFQIYIATNFQINFLRNMDDGRQLKELEVKINNVNVTAVNPQEDPVLEMVMEIQEIYVLICSDKPKSSVKKENDFTKSDFKNFLDVVKGTNMNESRSRNDNVSRNMNSANNNSVHQRMEEKGNLQNLQKSVTTIQEIPFMINNIKSVLTLSHNDSLESHPNRLNLDLKLDTGDISLNISPSIAKRIDRLRRIVEVEAEQLKESAKDFDTFDPFGAFSHKSKKNKLLQAIKNVGSPETFMMHEFLTKVHMFSAYKLKPKQFEIVKEVRTKLTEKLPFEKQDDNSAWIKVISEGESAQEKYLEWRAQKDFKKKQEERLLRFMTDQGENILFLLSTIFEDVYGLLTAQKNYLELLVLNMEIMPSGLKIDINDEDLKVGF